MATEVSAEDFPLELTVFQSRRRPYQCGLFDGDGFYVTEAAGEQVCIRCGGYGRVAEPQGGVNGD